MQDEIIILFFFYCSLAQNVNYTLWFLYVWGNKEIAFHEKSFQMTSSSSILYTFHLCEQPIFPFRLWNNISWNYVLLRFYLYSKREAQNKN